MASPLADRLPIKILKGPRQVGKTTLLEDLKRYKLISFDDLSIRQRANENPAQFLDQFGDEPLILDEATLAPQLFFELKRRVDESRRQFRESSVQSKNRAQGKILDYWITGSNQTLLSRSIQESLAGRASYFNLNTLSVHEIGSVNLPELMLRGGWPELHKEPQLSPVRYLNDLISTFIERDIVATAAIQRREAFSKTLALAAGQIGQLLNASSIGAQVGEETTTIQSWLSILEQNGLLRRVSPYFNSINKRIIKTPKIYFEDVGLAVRLQGWTDYLPMSVSPYYSHLIENLALNELVRFFMNRGDESKIYFVRTKEQVEVDFIVELPNQRFVAIEVKATPQDYTAKQLQLLDSLKLNIVEKWIVTVSQSGSYADRKVVPLAKIFEELNRFYV